ncbi:signal peptidase II [Deinococcus aquatilis]|jgi:signal peptidase II|uniref:signal peptidase II n=1 Tax=Deinococcus aquatilis TaxID=519440 RepID=UPI00035F4E15|nr:signal peptidase II [Deinococcus aquatilis]
MVALLSLEAGLKYWAVQTLSPGADRVVLPGLLHLGFTLNTGMAWGLLGSLTLPLALLRVAVGTGLLWGLLKRRVTRQLWWPLSFIATGALGNGLDGLLRGAVVDYLTSPLLDVGSRVLTGRPFPIFNLSDVLVCAGVFWLAVQTLWQDRKAGHLASARRDISKES